MSFIDDNGSIVDPYRNFIHVSRYSRWLEDKNRRETWVETVDRYMSFMKKHLVENYRYNENDIKFAQVRDAILHHKVMPSMRAMMTAGPALERDNVAGYNCAFLAVDSLRAFDEAMYILMCFHPDTLVKTRLGPVAISELSKGDEVLSYDEPTEKFVWRPISNVVETPSANLQKVEIELENGQIIKCTSNHKWLTENRGWIEAGKLTIDDDLVSPKFVVYSATNIQNGKSYVGYTSKDANSRFIEHIRDAKNNPKSQSHFHKAILKHGFDVWQIETIDFAYSSEEAKQKESNCIKKMDTKNTGYNSTDGGEGTHGYKWTDEQRLNAKKSAYERTPEHREYLRKVLISSQNKINKTKKTDEYIQAARQRNIGENNPMFGYNYSDEQREKKKEQAATRKRINGRFV